MPNQLFTSLHKIAFFITPRGPNNWPQRGIAASPLARRWIFKKRSLFRKVASDMNVTLLNFDSLWSRWRPRTVQKSRPFGRFLYSCDFRGSLWFKIDKACVLRVRAHTHARTRYKRTPRARARVYSQPSCDSLFTPRGLFTPSSHVTACLLLGPCSLPALM